MIRVATCVPAQKWMQAEKLDWLDKALAANSCDLFLLPQEYVGGGSCREICKLKNIQTDDVPVTEEWLTANVASLAIKHKVHIGFGATVTRGVITTEDYLYYDPTGKLLGYHSKIALPVQDSVVNGGNSGVTPETDAVRASSVIELPLLGLRVGTVFCWQVFFTHFWTELSYQRCNLVVHPIKFAPRGWYLKGFTADGAPTRVGFTQEKGSELPENDSLGWIRKLKYESEFKELPIAVTCNTWDGGEQFLALCGFVDEVTQRTDLHHLPSTAATDKVVVTSYDPSLYDELSHLSLAVYARFIDDWPALMQGTMRRKAVRIEQRAGTDRTIAKVAVAHVKEDNKREQLGFF